MLKKKIALYLSITMLTTACTTTGNNPVQNSVMVQTPPQAQNLSAVKNTTCYAFVVRALAGEWLKSLVLINGPDIGYKKAAEYLGKVDYMSSEYDVEVYSGHQCVQLQKTYHPKRVFVYHK